MLGIYFQLVSIAILAGNVSPVWYFGFGNSTNIAISENMSKNYRTVLYRNFDNK